MNNTFVEWAAAQPLRRALRFLVTRFGVRDKLKPFTSLLLFSQPRPSEQIPIIEDPVGSFIDIEQLSYYIWLNAEKNAACRKRTLYLFLAEGFDRCWRFDRMDWSPQRGPPEQTSRTYTPRWRSGSVYRYAEDRGTPSPPWSHSAVDSSCRDPQSC